MKHRLINTERIFHGAKSTCALVAKKILITCAALMLLAFHGQLYAGRSDKSGTASAPELLIPVGARIIALGGSQLSTVAGVEALYWNPAGLARSRGGVMFSHMNYLADIGVDYFAAGGQLSGIGSAAISVKMLSFGKINITTEDFPDGTGETTSPRFLIIGGTFSREISDHISAGITANVIYESMAKVSASGIAFNAGVQYSGIGGVEGLSVGAVVKNIGPALRYDGTGLLRTAQIYDASLQNSPVKIQAAASDLPSTIEIGLAYKMPLSEDGEMNISSAFQNNNFSDDEYKFGVEYVYKGLFSLEAGYALSPASEMTEYIYGPSAGIRLERQMGGIDVSFEYCYRSVKYFSGNHVFGLNIEF